MKRRDFLKTPAVSLLVPATGGLAALDPLASFDSSTGAEPGAPIPEQRIHPDFITYRPGIEYFFLGNGDMQAALQYAPDRSGPHPQSFLGLTLMDAERFSRKWSTYLFHPERGYENSALAVSYGGQGYSAKPENLRDVAWTLVDSVPVVRITWQAGALEVTEELFVPDEGGYLVRQVRVRNTGGAVDDLRLSLALVPNFTLFDEIGTDPATGTAFGRGYTEVTLRCLDGKVETSGRYVLNVQPGTLPAQGEQRARFVYTIRAGTPPLRARDMDQVWKKTVAFWRDKAVLRSSNEVIDRLYMLSRTGLKAQQARSGKRDSGYWMYNMEWVRDDVMMLQAMVMAGLQEEAKTVLVKILDKAVGPDGCAIESSRWSGYDYTELDQNGQILYAVWVYLSWTGDTALVRKYWKKIVLAGDFPMLDVFRDTTTRLLRNKREFWERDDRFGVVDGYELVYQFWVAYGLELGSGVARHLGDTDTAERWARASAELREITFQHPSLRFIENGRLIKRRTRAGEWQQHFVPANRGSMPPGSPIATIATPECDPDTGTLYPIIFGYVDPRGPVAAETVRAMDRLWNQRWEHGGYARYNTDSEPDPPGPWPIATMLIARAALEGGDHDRVWKSLNWVAGIHGGKSGGWFERYGASITPPAPPVSTVGWVWAEIVVFVIHHLMGFQPELKEIVLQPRLLSGLDSLTTRFSVRGGAVDYTLERGEAARAVLNGREIPFTDGMARIPFPARGKVSTVVITTP